MAGLKTIASKESLEYGSEGGNERKYVDAFGDGLVDSIVPDPSTDDPNLPVLTWRFFIISTGLAAFGGILSQISIFKPQPVLLSMLFLIIIGYICGLGLAWVGYLVQLALPNKKSRFAKFVYPGPFNLKEHAAITIVASTTASSAFATNLTASSDLFYDRPLGALMGILLVYSSQLLGYGFAGLFRASLINPTATYYPGVLSQISLYDTLHNQVGELGKYRSKIFWTLSLFMLVWEWFPQWMAPTLQGVSIICLLNQQSNSFTQLFGPSDGYNWGGVKMFTHIFGGAQGNEGYGIGAVSFDWLLIGSSTLNWPWATQVNLLLGVFLCITLTPIFYAANIWKAQNFPFMAQGLYTEYGDDYNLTSILNPDLSVNATALDQVGLPYLAMTNAYSNLCYNMSVTAAITHLLLYNRKTIIDSYNSIFRNKQGDLGKMNKHYKAMAIYEEVPQWWYLLCTALSLGVAFWVCYSTGSGLAWWALLVAVVLSFILTFVVGFLTATTGFGISCITVIQMIGGFLQPGLPYSNMFFTVYGYQSVQQATAMMADLKIGQYLKLPPKITFLCQVWGCLVGGICNYLMTESIIDQQRDVLITVEGNQFWNGGQIASFYSAAVCWGGVPYELFGPSGVYFPVTLGLLIGFFLPFPFYFLHKLFPKAGFNYFNTSILCWFLVYLTVGSNSQTFTYLGLGLFSQFYLRKYRTEWFANYNYIVSAALDAGTYVSVFMISMLVQGVIYPAIPFPTWALNPDIGDGSTIHLDYCPKAPPLPSSS